LDVQVAAARIVTLTAAHGQEFVEDCGELMIISGAAVGGGTFLASPAKFRPLFATNNVDFGRHEQQKKTRLVSAHQSPLFLCNTISI